MPPHDIMAGMPIDIIPFIMSQHAFIISSCDGSMGVILQTMPSGVISQVMRAIIMARIIIGMPIMPPPIIIGFIIGACMGICICICGIGIIIGMPIPPMGMPPIAPIIGMGIGMGMGIICISGIIMGAAFMATSRGLGRAP